MARNDDTSRSLQDLRDVLDLWRSGETMADKFSPLLKVGRAAEIDGVILQRFPGDEQPIVAWLFDRALQFHAAAAHGALKQRPRIFHAGLECRFHTRF
jgi:hypothetical protein